MGGLSPGQEARHLVHGVPLVGVQLEAQVFRRKQGLVHRKAGLVLLVALDGDGALREQAGNDAAARGAELPGQLAPVAGAVEGEPLEAFDLLAGVGTHGPGRIHGQNAALAPGGILPGREHVGKAFRKLFCQGLALPGRGAPDAGEGYGPGFSLAGPGTVQGDLELPEEGDEEGDGLAAGRALAGGQILQHGEERFGEQGPVFQGPADVFEDKGLALGVQGHLVRESAHDGGTQGACAHRHGAAQGRTPESLRKSRRQGVGEVQVGRLEKGDDGVHGRRRGIGDERGGRKKAGPAPGGWQGAGPGKREPGCSGKGGLEPGPVREQVEFSPS